MKKIKTKYTYDSRRDRIIYGPTYKGIRKFFYGYSDKEIDAKVEAWKESIDSGSINKRKMQEFIDEYWNTKQNEISPTSYNGYNIAVKRIEEEFGDYYPSEITPQMVYQWLDRFKAQDYSAKTINNTKSVLKSIFDIVFINGDITNNPCITLPQIKGKAKVPRQPASDDDIRILEQCKTESLESRMWYFMLYTGARRGEAAALQWKDIDLAKKIARVNKTLVYGNTSTAKIKNHPKTEAGIRCLQLTDNLIDVLPTRSKDDDYIFYPNGFPTRKLFEKSFDKFKKEHNLSCTPHQLRHSYASMLHSAGVDVKDAQSLLGHANVSVTQDVYTHLESDHADDVRNNLNRYIQEKKIRTTKKKYRLLSKSLSKVRNS